MSTLLVLRNLMTRSESLRFLKTYVITTTVLLLVLIPLIVAANHNKGTFPNTGHLWMSSRKSFSGAIYVTSTNCNSDQVSAYSRIKNSTTGTTEMPEWKSGINMKQYTCFGTWNNSTDIRIRHVATQSSPGLNIDTMRDSAFCAYWGTTYPCGVRSEVTIRQSWWDTASSLSRQRLIMHETGHSMGLNHHCTANSIMNDGSSTCNNGVWTTVMTYQPTDRIGINNVY